MIDPQFLIQHVFPVVLFIVMLTMGLSLTVGDFARIAQMPGIVAFGLTGQLVLLPAVAILIGMLLPLPDSVRAGLIILSACPAGSVSNAITYAAKGDVALAITLTAGSSLVTVFTIPFVVLTGFALVGIDAGRFALDPLTTILQLATMLVLPVVIGMVVRTVMPAFAFKAEKVMKVVALVLLFLMVTAGTIANVDPSSPDFVWGTAATLLTLIITIAIAWAGATILRLADRQKLTIAIEIGVQNVALAFLIAGTMMRRPDYLGTPAIYGATMLLVVAAVIGMARRSTRET